MSIQRADARFLLPFAPTSATVCRGMEAWEAGLDAAGVSVVNGGAAPELAVARSDDVASAAATGARALLLERRPVRSVRGYSVRRFLPISSIARPELLVPVDRANIVRYVFDTWTFPTNRLRIARKPESTLSGRSPTSRRKKSTSWRSTDATWCIVPHRT